MYGYIYRITDLTNGKCYIGQHKYDKPMLDPTYHGSGYIIKNIFKKRPETLLEEILMICATKDELNYFETYFIERMGTIYPNGYNLMNGGEVHGVSENTKKKMSIAKKGKPSKRKGIPRPKNVTDKIRTKLTKFFFNYSDLYHLYIEMGLSTYKIAQMYGCDHNTIWLKLKKYNIQKVKPSISFDDVYREYILNDLTINQCASMFNCSRNQIIGFIRKYKIKKTY